MTNLLPPQEQKAVWASYRARFAFVLALVLFALALAGLLALAPSYLALEIAAPPTPTQVATTTTPAETTAVARAQALIRVLAPIGSATTSPSAAIQAALNDRPQGISVTHIVYTADNQTSIELVGVGSRDAVSAYQGVLSKDPLFSAVSVPVSALVGSVDGHFTLTLTLK